MRRDNGNIEDRRLLMNAARDGCRESLGRIYGKYGPMICDFLRKAGTDGAAEDVCQADNGMEPDLAVFAAYRYADRLCVVLNRRGLRFHLGI